MPYDSSLDEKLFSEVFEVDEDNRITVSVYSYNKGAKKLQISRENRNAQGEMRFAKLGRLNKAEAEGILPLFQKAIAEMG